jgi:response regulator of citrate/malate metabolism
MPSGLNVIIVDDDPAVCEVISETIKEFYQWGEVFAFSDPDEALVFCKNQETGVAIFVMDVFIGDRIGFNFLDAILDKFPMAYQDAIVITGNASEDVVDICLASDITYLLEKPVKRYALQLAVRSIVSKYVKFARRLMEDPVFAECVASF